MIDKLSHPALKKYQEHPIGIVEISVPFHDVDIMEVVWHGNYLKYFEIARCKALQIIDYDFAQMKESGYAWPIVDIRSRYTSPVKYGDSLYVIAVIVEWDIRLLLKYFVINKSDLNVVTKGQSIQVPIETSSMSMNFGCPDILSEKIRIWKRQQGYS